jgi:hypothetical protein
LGEAGGLNLYQFVGNDPVNWVDPDGLQPVRVLPRPPPVQGEITREMLNALRSNYGPNYRTPYERLLEHAAQNALWRERMGRPLEPGEAFLSPPDFWQKQSRPICIPKAAKTLPTPQYYIQEGVRGSVAVREAGLTEVPATIFREGQAPVTTTLPINQLFSPKDAILRDSRFLSIQPPIQVPIRVQPLGLPGQGQPIPLLDVKLLP